MGEGRATARRLEIVLWAMIYSGLLVAAVGWALIRIDAAWGWLLIGAGALDAAVGVVLLWVRSRVAGNS